MKTYKRYAMVAALALVGLWSTVPVLLVSARWVSVQAQIRFWDWVEHDNAYILVGLEAIPYTVNMIRRGTPRSEWYAVMLREILEGRDIALRRPTYVPPLRRSVGDLTEISRTGNPRARKSAQKALTWMREYSPELFPKSDG